MFNIRFRERTNTWPGFVDLFSNLVIILIFLLIVFVFLWTTTSVFNKRTGIKTVTQLKQANAEQMEKIQQMTADEQEAKRLLILARAELETLESSNAELNDELNQMDMSVEDLVTAYEAKVSELQTQGRDMQAMVDSLTAQLNQATIDKAAAAELEQQRKELQDQMQTQRAELSQQLADLQAALDAAEEKSRTQEIQYVEMSTRLNTVQPDGDRFIVSSDILFPSGSYTLSPEGKNQLRLIANVIKDFENKIPSDVNWIIRVDGHTDKKPVVPGTRGYRNNMELSLRRATAVADALSAAGVSRRRLLPSGFGDLYPVELGNSPDALQKNRRIELQLTNR